jgi:hypothetical protein
MITSKKRRGKTLITELEHKDSLSTFCEIDHLDTKLIENADNNYEKVFIVIRDYLLDNESYICDDEDDRLTIAQSICDLLRQNCLIRREKM